MMALTVQADFWCGACSLKFQSIDFLHDHLQNHVEGGSYIYNHISKTAFPKFQMVCAFTQFNVSDFEERVSDISEMQMFSSKTNALVNYSKNEGTNLIGNEDSKCIFTGTPPVTEMEVSLDDTNIDVCEEKTNIDTCSYNSNCEDNQRDDVDLNDLINERKLCVKSSKKTFVSNDFSKETYSSSNNRNKGVQDRPILWLRVKGDDLKPGQIQLKKMEESKHAEYDVNAQKGHSDYKDVLLNLNDLDEFGTSMTQGADELDTFLDVLASPNIERIAHTDMDIGDSKIDYSKEKQDKQKRQRATLETEIKRSKERSVMYTGNALSTALESDGAAEVLKLSETLTAPLLSTETLLRESSKPIDFSDRASISSDKPRVPCFVVLPRKNVTRRGKYYTYECQKCGQVGTHSMVTYHKYLHKENKELSCEKCGRLFQNPVCLKVHMKLHGEREYKCTECGAAFHRKKNLDVHLLRHSGERPYMCELCGKSYRETSELRRHKKFIHEQIRNHTCEICGDKFFRPEHLRNHRKRHFEPELKCQYCGRGFKLKCDLVRHTTIHTGEKSCYCSLCGEGFRYTTPYYRHMKSKHNIERDTAKEMRLQRAADGQQDGSTGK